MLNNRPIGDSFRPFWGGDPKVQIGIDNVIVERFRSKKNNTYSLIKDDQIEVFKSFKSSVPDTISEIFNISDFNIQRQIDGPFLISKSSAEAARYFNSLVKLDDIDIFTRNISTILKSEKNLLNISKEKRVDLETELKAYDFIDVLDLEVEKAEKLDKKIQILQNEFNSLSDLCVRFDFNLKSISKFNKIILYKNDIDELFQFKNKVLDVENLYKKLNNTVNIIVRKSAFYNIYNAIISKKDKVESLINLAKSILDKNNVFFSLENLICDFDSQLKDFVFNKKLVNIDIKVSRLIDLIESITRSKAEYSVLEQKYSYYIRVFRSFAKSKKEYKDYVKEYKSLMPSICPLCEQEIKKEYI